MVGATGQRTSSWLRYNRKREHGFPRLRNIRPQVRFIPLNVMHKVLIGTCHASFDRRSFLVCSLFMHIIDQCFELLFIAVRFGGTVYSSKKGGTGFCVFELRDNRCCPEASPADKAKIQKRICTYSCMHSIMARHATPNNALASAFVDKCATMGIDAPLAVLEYLRSIPSALIWNQKDNVAEYPPLGTGRRVTGSGLPCMICIHFPRTVFCQQMGVLSSISPAFH